MREELTDAAPLPIARLSNQDDLCGRPAAIPRTHNCNCSVRGGPYQLRVQTVACATGEQANPYERVSIPINSRLG